MQELSSPKRPNNRLEVRIRRSSLPIIIIIPEKGSISTTDPCHDWSSTCAVRDPSSGRTVSYGNTEYSAIASHDIRFDHHLYAFRASLQQHRPICGI